MITKLAFLHTSHVLIPVFSQLAKSILPEVGTFHMTDESLIKNTIETQGLTKSTVRRVSGFIELAHEGGADAVMVTCSSIGPAIPVARRQFDFPILRIDEAMAEAAVAQGKRIGVAATLRTTLDPTLALLRDTATAAGKEVELIPALADGAFEAVVSGDADRHDQLVKELLAKLKAEVEIVVLAQASMARVVPMLSPEGAPILTSPELAVRRARSVLRLDEPVATA